MEGFPRARLKWKERSKYLKPIFSPANSSPSLSFVSSPPPPSLLLLFLPRPLSLPVHRMWNWFTDYIGTIEFDPKNELAEIPNHSAFFILSPDNRSQSNPLPLLHMKICLSISIVIFPAVFVCSATSWYAPKLSMWSHMSLYSWEVLS